MNLRRSKNKAVADSIKSIEDINLYIRLIIDIFSSTEINRNYWLTEREKEFYVSTVIHYINGYLSPIQEESIQIYKKYFNKKTNKAKISDYINRVRTKGWLKYNKKTKEIEIPQIFHGISSDGDSITFNLRFDYGKTD